ncbi:MAG: MaoC family dehydratase N-terminal domain-containing protein [Pseudomonadota bacterium]
MAQLDDWIGKSETSFERIAPFPSNALAATLDRDDPAYEDGTPLPPLWHWLHFLQVFKLSDAGYDGHATLGGFLPLVPLPRRMWAGGRLTFHEPMRIGQELTRVSTIKSVEMKEGRSGQLVFVTVQHRISDGELLCVEEEHDIVYRDRPDPGAPVQAPPQASETGEFSREVVADPVLLFRYSALTFNGHRIHYDHPFCTGSEGYEGLVVHGPLLATLLLDLLRRHRPEVVVKSFDFRAISTVFGAERFSLQGAAEEEGKAFRLWARRQDGAVAMQAKATIR